MRSSPFIIQENIKIYVHVCRERSNESLIIHHLTLVEGLRWVMLYLCVLIFFVSLNNIQGLLMCHDRFGGMEFMFKC